MIKSNSGIFCNGGGLLLYLFIAVEGSNPGPQMYGRCFATELHSSLIVVCFS